MEHDLQQQVAEFVLEVVEVVAVDGIGDLVGFLDRVRRDAGEGLLHVPGTAMLTIAQARHDLEEALDVVLGCGHCFAPITS
jgi:hypothetical protein